MSLVIDEEKQGKILEVTVSDKLTKEDYQLFGPQVEKDIREKGKVRILFHMQDFHGWNAGGLWEDAKFYLKHFSDIERLAMVGDKKWEKSMAALCKPFTTAKVRFFTPFEIEAARLWLEEET